MNVCPSRLPTQICPSAYRGDEQKLPPSRSLKQTSPDLASRQVATPLSLTITISSPTRIGEGIFGTLFFTRQAISGRASPVGSFTARSSGCMKLVLMKAIPWPTIGRGTIENPSTP